MESKSISAEKTQRILYLLSRFLNDEIIKLKGRDRADAFIFHYYNEIIRYWSKINFIIKKTLRSVAKTALFDDIEMNRYLYSTYRLIWEDAPKEAVLKELEPYLNMKKEDFIVFLDRLRSLSWDRALEGKNEIEKLSIEEAVPSFVIKHLAKFIPFEFLKENIRYMNNLSKKKTFTVFVKGKIEPHLKEHIKFQEDQDVPNLFHIPMTHKYEIIHSKSYQSRDLIILDKGSALIASILEPKKNETICDFCAAPGIKTSLISLFTNDSVKIIAGDFHTERTELMKDLISSLKASKIHILNEDSIHFPIRYENYFDRILLDAPCTGSGTFLSNPEIKWRQKEDFLHQNITLQKKLIKSALKLLKPNGILVYSTCSLYPEEGEERIMEFREHLEPLDLPSWCSPSYKINNSILPGTGRLFPSVHKTQGFFIGKFKKKE